MPRIRQVLAVLGLVVGGTATLSTMPATAENSMLWNCNAVWERTGIDGKVRAFRDGDCNSPLGSDAGNDYDWGDNTGQFQGRDTEAASSLMNNGFKGGRENVAFYNIITSEPDSPAGGVLGCCTALLYDTKKATSDRSEVAL